MGNGPESRARILESSSGAVEKFTFPRIPTLPNPTPIHKMTSSPGSEDVDDETNPSTPLDKKMHALEMRWSAQKSISLSENRNGHQRTDDSENPVQGRQPTAIESPKPVGNENLERIRSARATAPSVEASTVSAGIAINTPFKRNRGSWNEPNETSETGSYRSTPTSLTESPGSKNG